MGDTVGVEAALLAREIGREDWLAHLPLALVFVAFVFVIDAIVFARILRRRSRDER